MSLLAWKKLNDPDNRLTIMDTKAASGRLGLIAMASAQVFSPIR